jgi:hypothetical protein
VPCYMFPTHPPSLHSLWVAAVPLTAVIWGLCLWLLLEERGVTCRGALKMQKRLKPACRLPAACAAFHAAALVGHERYFRTTAFGLTGEHAL